MKLFNQHAFSPIKGEQKIPPTRLFRTTLLFGPLEYPAILSQLENDILKFNKTNSVNGSNSAEKTRKVINSNKDNQRNSWLLVANDGVGRDHLVFFQSFDGTTKFQPFYC